MQDDMCALSREGGANVGLIGQAYGFFAVDDQGFAGLNSQAGGFVFGHGLDRLGPDDRYVKAIVLGRLRCALPPRHPPEAIAPPRIMARSVPSIASMATMAFSLTTTVCPISMPPMSLAMVSPKINVL